MVNLSQRNGSSPSKLSPGGGYGTGGSGIGPLTQQAIRETSPLLQGAIRESGERKTRGAGKRVVPAIAAKIGLGLARRNPYVRMANMAFDAAMSLAPDAPWAIQEEPKLDDATVPVVPYPGWYVSCFDPSIPWSRGYGIGSSQWASCPGGICGSSGHVNTGDGLGPTLTNETKACTSSTAMCGQGFSYQERHVIAGPMDLPMELPQSRFQMKIKICRVDSPPCGGPDPNPAWCHPNWRLPLPYLPQVAIPVPDVRPAPPTILERYPPDPVDRRPPQFRRKKDPARHPYRKPAVSLELKPDGKKGPPRFDDHILRPPNEDEREKKTNVRWRDALKLLAWLYDAATEAVDIVDILWDAMTKKPPYRPGRPYTFPEKAAYIWENLEHLDAEKAVKDLVRNHYEDKYIYGKIFGTIGKHTQYGTLGPGYGGFLQV